MKFQIIDASLPAGLMPQALGVIETLLFFAVVDGVALVARQTGTHGPPGDDGALGILTAGSRGTAAGRVGEKG